MDDTGLSPMVAALTRQAQQKQLLENELATGRSLFMRPMAQGYGTLGGFGAGLSNLGRGLFGGLMVRNAGEGLTQNADDTAKARQGLAAALMGGTPSPAPSPMAAALTSGGEHPIPTSTPIREPGGALATPPAQVPQAANYATGGIDPNKLAALIASGDPVLGQLGETMLGTARQQRQMGFEADQAQKNREQQMAIANRPQFHNNGMMGGGFLVFPDTGEVRTIAGPNGAGGGELNPYPVGSKPFEQTEKIAKDLEGSVDIAHIPASLQQDVLRLQLGQNLQGAVQQAQATGWNKTMRTLVAGELQKLVNGVAGSESELEAIGAKSGIGGAISDIANAMSGDISGPALAKYTQFVSDFANREHALAQNRLGTYLDGQLGGGQGAMLKQLAPKRFEAVREAALQKLAGLGEVQPPGGQKTVPAAGLNLDTPAPSHYLVSPDGKMRIAADANGKPLPNAKPEPVNG
jgi:hypothetical protein